ncbi:MAG: hypothetical protein K2I00_00890 [Ruminococcus sp.]|nr:hypothetical protein [Ruminococcus sp.]
MKKMIENYTKSCELAINRIKELKHQKKQLEEKNQFCKIDELNLERRIRVLYEEYAYMNEIINRLTCYLKWKGGI